MRHAFDPRFDQGSVMVIFLTLAAVGCGERTDSSPQLQGVSLLQAGKPQEAIEHFDQLLAGDADAPQVFYHRGRAYQAVGNLPHAVEDYETALELNSKLSFNLADVDPSSQRARRPLFPPEKAQLLTQLGVIHNQQQEYDQAIDKFTAAIEIDSSQAGAYTGRGVSFLAKGLWDLAIDDLTAALQHDGDLGEAFYQRARAHMAAGNLIQAIEDARFAIRREPKLAQAYQTLGAAYLANEEPAKASNCFEEALRLDTSLLAEVESLRAAAGAKMKLLKPIVPGEIPGATDVSASEPNAQTHVMAGFAQLQQQNYLAATEEFTTALRLDEASSAAHYGRGLAFLERGFPDTAYEDLTQSIQLSKSYVDAYWARARAASGLGRYHTALRDSTQAILLEPGHANAYFERGLAYLELGEHERAIADLQEAKRLAPQRSQEIDRVIGDALLRETAADPTDETQAES